MDTSHVPESVIVHLEAAILKLEHDLVKVKKFLQESTEDEVPVNFYIEGSKHVEMVTSKTEGFTMTVGHSSPSGDILISTIKGNLCKVSIGDPHGASEEGVMFTRDVDSGEVTMLDHKGLGEATLIKGNTITNTFSTVCKKDDIDRIEQMEIGESQSEYTVDIEEKSEEPNGSDIDQVGLGINPYQREMEPLCLSCHDVVFKDRNDHPLFEGSICEKCKECLMESVFWLDDDGCFFTDEYTCCPLLQGCCCICGKGFSQSQVVCSTNSCGRAYCEACLSILLGGRGKAKIDAEDDWSCFLCTLEPQGRIVPREDWQAQLIKLYEPATRITTPSPKVTPNWIRSRRQKGIRVLSLADNISAVFVTLRALEVKVDTYYKSEIRERARNIGDCNNLARKMALDMLEITKEQISDILPIDLVVAAPPVPKFDDKEDLEKKLEPLRKVFKILDQIQRENGKTNHVYWLIDIPVTISSSLRKEISATLKMEPVLWNAQCFTPVMLTRLYWGNLPDLSSCLENYQTHGYKNNLDEFLSKNHITRREALVSHIRPQVLLGLPPESVDDPELRKLIRGTRTILRNFELEANEFWVKEDPANFQLPVKMNGYKSELWLEEMDGLMGFPVHYTDCNSGRGVRLFLISNSSSVHVLKHILRPLAEQLQKSWRSD